MRFNLGRIDFISEEADVLAARLTSSEYKVTVRAEFAIPGLLAVLVNDPATPIFYID